MCSRYKWIGLALEDLSYIRETMQRGDTRMGTKIPDDDDVAAEDFLILSLIRNKENAVFVGCSLTEEY